MTEKDAATTASKKKGFKEKLQQQWASRPNLDPRVYTGDAVRHATTYVANMYDDARVNITANDKPLPSKQAAVDLLQTYGPSLDMKIDRATHVIAACESLESLEVITDSGRGGRAIQAKKGLEDKRDAAKQLLARRNELLEALAADSPDEKTLQAVNRFEIRFQMIMEDISKATSDVPEQLQKVLTDEAIKAWVRENPSADHKRLEKALNVVGQGINAVAFAGEVLGYVPNEEAQGVAIGLQVGASVAETGKAVTDRYMLSVSADVQIDQYRKKYGEQQIYTDLRYDMIAEMLAAKRLADVELALQLTQPVWTAAAAKFPPAVDRLWPWVCDVIIACVKEYQAERIAKAKRLAGEEAPKEDIVKVFGEEYLLALEEKIKGNVFTVLNPLELATSALITTLAGRIAAAIVAKLPVEPAQLIDGADLRAHIESLVTAQLKSTFLEPSVPEDRFAGLTLPSEVDGTKVEAILSPVLGTGDERHVYLRCVDGAVYRWFATGAFERIGADDPDGARYLTVPRVDHLGRTLTEVIAGTVIRHPDDGYDCYRARFRDLNGLVQIAEPHTFTPLAPHDSAYADWRHRSVTPDGYREIVEGRAGEMVTGIWRQPWAGSPNYVFVHADGRGRQWANGTAPTGDPGLLVLHQLDGKVPVGYDLDTRID